MTGYIRDIKQEVIRQVQVLYFSSILKFVDLNTEFNLQEIMEDIAEKLGIRLRDLRNEAGISQEKFALQIGMDRTYYTSVEAGKRNVSLKNLKKIADGFGISLSEMFYNI